MHNQEKFDILEIRDHYPNYNNPSSSTWVLEQVKGLIKLNFNPLVISPTPINPLKFLLRERFRLYDWPTKKIREYKGTKVIRPPYLKVPYNKLMGITLKNLSKCIKNHGNLKSIKLIHAHFGQNGYASLELKRALNVPLITSFYGYDSGRLSNLFLPFYQYLIRDGDLFLALSKNMKDDLIKLGFDENKILIHHLGIDFREFKQVFNKKDKFTILTVARLYPVKGIQFVIEAISKFLIKYPSEKIKLEYKIIGGGPYEFELKKMVKVLGLDNNIFFINNLILPNSREIVISEMQNCDIFCLCSYISEDGSKEGTPVVLMEAQSCNKPCISTFHAGISEVVINGCTGILTEERSVGGILKAMELLYFNPEIREAFGANAAKYIKSEFNHETQIGKLSAIFKRILYDNK